MLWLLSFTFENRTVNPFRIFSRMEFKPGSSHDPLLLKQLSQLLKAGSLTLQSNRLTLYLFGSQSCFSEVMRQGLNLPWDRESSWCLSFGKRLTWRRSQHGLVGLETTVNSGPFSQLPAETNTNDYLAIVSIEATRHLWMFTESFAPRRSLARELWESAIPFIANSESIISLCCLGAVSHSFISLCRYERVQLAVFYLYQNVEKSVAAKDTDVFKSTKVLHTLCFLLWLNSLCPLLAVQTVGTGQCILTIATKWSRFMPGLLALVSASLSRDEIRNPAAFPAYPPWEATYEVRITVVDKHTCTHTFTIPPL